MLKIISKTTLCVYALRQVTFEVVIETQAIYIHILLYVHI